MYQISLPASWQDWEIGEEIGWGTSGVVYRIRHKESGRVCAMKRICVPKQEAKAIHDCRREVQLLMALRGALGGGGH